MTELLYLRDSYVSSFTAVVVEARGGSVALDRTAFYATCGVRPNDTAVRAGCRVVELPGLDERIPIEVVDG